MTAPDDLPGWWQPLLRRAASVAPEELSRFLPPEEGGRESAVLILLGETPDGDPDVLLIERAHDLRSHPRQVAFPGGVVDETDADVVAAALRESEEETGLDPAGVRVLATLPALFLPPSGFIVNPVLAWWERPSPVSVVDPREVASVHRVQIAELADPANRFKVSHPSGYIGPAFSVRGLLVWGFTAGLLDRLLRLGDWERPWDQGRVEPLPPEMIGARR